MTTETTRFTSVIAAVKLTLSGPCGDSSTDVIRISSISVDYIGPDSATRRPTIMTTTTIIWATPTTILVVCTTPISSFMAHVKALAHPAVSTVMTIGLPIRMDFLVLTDLAHTAMAMALITVEMALVLSVAGAATVVKALPRADRVSQLSAEWALQEAWAWVSEERRRVDRRAARARRVALRKLAQVWAAHKATID